MTLLGIPTPLSIRVSTCLTLLEGTTRTLWIPSHGAGDKGELVESGEHRQSLLGGSSRCIRFCNRNENLASASVTHRTLGCYERL